jgi:hypothetical protein
MQIIEISTLIDITNTQITRPNQGTQLEIDQHRNFITLIQCAEIRSIISFDNRPVVSTVDVKGLGFGSEYKGKHRIWTFTFVPDRVDVYLDNKNNELGALASDLDNVPIIKNLTETVNIAKAVFDCNNSATKNITIKALQGKTI